MSAKHSNDKDTAKRPISPAPACQVSACLSLIVIRCADLETSKRFYEAIGCKLQREKHGNGPVHYSFESGKAVLELYPASTPSKSIGTRLGFMVDKLHEAVDNLRAQALLDVIGSEDVAHGRVVVVDPDGHKVELSSERPAAS